MKIAVQIQAIFSVIGRWTRESSRNPMAQELELVVVKMNCQALWGLA